MNVCHDGYKMFNSENEISPCCDCSSDLRLMERSSPAPFCSKLILIFLLKNPSKRNSSVKETNMKLNHGESCFLWTCLAHFLWHRPLGFLHWWSLCLCLGDSCAFLPEVEVF